MILAGIDEAGYGPLLGPLVVGCCAFEVNAAEGAAPGEVPCLWKRLKKVVSKNRVKGGKRLHVNDSKAVYSPAVGLKELERSVLALATACNDRFPESLPEFVRCVAAGVMEELETYRWYGGYEGEKWPLEQEAAGVRIFANALKAEQAKGDCRIVHLAARVVHEKQLNGMLEQTRNKGATLFSIAATHLDYLLKAYGDRGLTIFCDRQGGREHYGSLLRMMFEEWELSIEKEEEGYAEYSLTRRGGGRCGAEPSSPSPGVPGEGEEGGHVGPHPTGAGEGEVTGPLKRTLREAGGAGAASGERDVARIVFCEKAEGQCMPVAVASMLCKYLREALMGRFNAYWRTHLPELRPTAGYYSDGMRFLADIEVKRKELGVGDFELIRAK